jgi:hypothetical protein
VVWLRSGVPVATAGFGAAREVRAIKSLIEAGVPVAASMLADPAIDLKQLGRGVLTPAPCARAI